MHKFTVHMLHLWLYTDSCVETQTFPDRTTVDTRKSLLTEHLPHWTGAYNQNISLQTTGDNQSQFATPTVQDRDRQRWNLVAAKLVKRWTGPYSVAVVANGWFGDPLPKVLVSVPFEPRTTQSSVPRLTPVLTFRMTARYATQTENWWNLFLLLNGGGGSFH